MSSLEDDTKEELATIVQPRQDLTEVRFRVQVSEGPDVGKSLELDGSAPLRVLIGQSPACELRLSDREVSRRHAALDVQRGKLRVSDLGSTNGTFVDGLAIAEVFMKGGETLRVGATTLRVLRETGASLPLPTETQFGRLVGESSAMRRLYPLCKRLAQTVVPVIIEGETGTGKEALAESMHEQGPRAAGPFVVFDCTAVPANLVESELFGHEKGAFTGAVNSRR